MLFEILLFWDVHYREVACYRNCIVAIMQLGYSYNTMVYVVSKISH